MRHRTENAGRPRTQDHDAPPVVTQGLKGHTPGTPVPSTSARGTTGLPFTGILITEAARSEGGYLVNKDGYRYLQDYDLGTPQAKPVFRSMELGPRERLSQAFVKEVQKGAPSTRPTDPSCTWTSGTWEGRRIAEGEYLQTPQELEAFKPFSMCINCMLCYSACPVYALDPKFVGPAAIELAQRYNLESRDEGAKERLEVLSSHEASGVARSSANVPRSARRTSIRPAPSSATSSRRRSTGLQGS